MFNQVLNQAAANIVLAKAGVQLHVEQNIKLARLRQYFSVSRHLLMRFSIKHIGLVVGISLVLVSLLFFGRRQGLYQIISLVGACIAVICLLWIIFGRGSAKSKFLCVGIVLLAMVIDVVAEPYLIDTSYRIYISQHKKSLSVVNTMLNSSKGDIWIMDDTVRVSNGVDIRPEDKQQLLHTKKQLGVYMIAKNDSAVYYGLWGFLDVRLGITYLTSQTMRRDRYRHITGSWYH